MVLDINMISNEDVVLYYNGGISFYGLQQKYNIDRHIISHHFKKYYFGTRKQYVYKFVEHCFFNKIDCSDKAYILGFYLADGCLLKYKNIKMISFHISLIDIGLLIKIKNILSPNSKINKIKQRTNKRGISTKEMCSLRIISNEIYDTLSTYNMGRNKTYIIGKSFNNIISDEFFWDFFRGYFDGDGCISSHKDNYSLTIVSYDLNILNDIKYKLLDFGISSNIYKHKTTYVIGIYKKDYLKQIYNYIYKKDGCLFMERKKSKFENILLKIKFTNENNSAKKKIIQYDLNGGVINYFESMSCAERELGIKHQNISACCRDKAKTAGGFKWGYLKGY